MWRGRILASVLQSSGRQPVVSGPLVVVRSQRLVAAALEDAVTCWTRKLGRQAGSGDRQEMLVGKPPSALSGSCVWIWCGRHWEHSRLQETGRVPCDGNSGRTAVTEPGLLLSDCHTSPYSILSLNQVNSALCRLQPQFPRLSCGERNFYLPISQGFGGDFIERGMQKRLVHFQNPNVLT